MLRPLSLRTYLCPRARCLVALASRYLACASCCLLHYQPFHLSPSQTPDSLGFSSFTSTTSIVRSDLPHASIDPAYLVEPRSALSRTCLHCSALRRSCRGSANQRVQSPTPPSSLTASCRPPHSSHGRRSPPCNLLAYTPSLRSPTCASKWYTNMVAATRLWRKPHARHREQRIAT